MPAEVDPTAPPVEAPDPAIAGLGAVGGDVVTVGAAKVEGLLVVPGKATAPYGFARLAPATPAVCGRVCAPAGAASAKESSKTIWDGLAMA